MRFGIPGAIRGASILDVSGSTPGFTAVLLELGAAHVTAISLGPSPLSPRLRADPRVVVLERAQMKTLPAAQAPGPFSFFAVDVRFVSSRTMLRAIAFRLVPGAHGIVWVRPQFEQRLDLFRDKATKLGFSIVAEAEAAPEDAAVAIHLHRGAQGGPVGRRSG